MSLTNTGNIFSSLRSSKKSFPLKGTFSRTFWIKELKIFPVFVSDDFYRPQNKNIHLIGDAFFSFSPSFAQGASQSIEVAHEIYKNLEGETNKFNDERIKRTKMINIKSKFNYFVFHLSNPLIIWIRNFIMCYLVKNKKFINSYLGKIYKD